MRNALCTLIFLATFAPLAAADWCDASKELAKEMSLDGVARIEVYGVSGFLEVTGTPGARRVSAKGEACARDGAGDRIDEIRIVEERDGSTLRVIAEVPYYRGDDWRIGGLDLEVTVPDNLPVKVVDTSGDVEIEQLASLELTDSSGDVRIRDIAGSVHIDRDSSGDLDIRDVGDVVIEADSSGGIEIQRAGSVRIDRDTSGSIYARDINGDMRVGRDSSGSIEVANVAGDFEVRRDTSGGIDYENVMGQVSIPDDD